ncbi:immunoglobulin-like domain-containing protein [Listeria booriae]|uniref:Bacterial Ig domain-containing protein n=1 Tax=Listeria booriae TaxID=1552123 RepID=A0A7X1CEQ7_9LIST|nr:immunoglobulin-like domain-containing protein [Listeria booriae]MBC1561615.1 hypothetical protein [Listeria booriae]
MIFKTQIAKKVLATSAALAILGGSIATPINVLSVEAAEAIQTATVLTTGSELINKDLSLVNNRFKNFTITGEYTNTPNAASGFELNGTDSNWYGLNGQTHRMVLKSNPFSYYFPETWAISETAGFTAVTIDTEVGKSYVFDYSYSLSNSNVKTADSNSKLNMEVGVSQYGGDKIKYNTYSLAGNQETTLTDKAQIEFKATSTKTIIYMRTGYTHMNSSGAQHFASLDSYSVTQVNIEADIQKEASVAVNQLFNGNSSGAAIKATTDLAAIQAAQLLVYKVTDSYERSKLQVELNQAYRQLDARLAIANLFENGNVNGKIKASTNQEAINAAQDLINNVSTNPGRLPLQADLNKAKNQLTDLGDGPSVEEEAEMNARTLVQALFKNNDMTGTIVTTLAQRHIDEAQKAVNSVTNPTIKAELQASLKKAQEQLNATNAVKGLFNNDNVAGTIKTATTQVSINDAKVLVGVVTNTAKKTELEGQIAEAQKQLDAKLAQVEEQARQEAATNAVKELFNSNDVTGTIKDSTNQDAINNAKELVAAITDTAKKAELEAQLAEAQKQVDAKTAEAAAEKARQEAVEKAIEGLFNNNDVNGTIKDSTTQDAIDQAKELVTTITDADKKAELEKAITEAQKQLTDKETKVEVTGKVNPFILHQDRYLSGTYTGDITAISVDVNGKRYYGGTVNDGEFSFYALDKIANPGDVVIINLHSADKVIQKSITVQIKEATKVTQAAYNVKDSNITGTFNNPDITKMNIVVNGTTYWGGTLTNGTFKFYALDKITSATDEVTMNFYNAKNELILSKNLTITAPVVTSGEITSATVAVGDKNIVGTITGDIKSFGVTIDGVTYNGGTITSDGTFKFYVADKKIKADSSITIVGYDKSKNTLSEVNIVVSK